LSDWESSYPIYGWYDSGTIYYYTEADNIYVNSDAEGMFYGLSALTELDVSNWNTSRVTNMSSMFVYCRNLT